MTNMKPPENRLHLLVVDDDEDDRLLIEEALERGHVARRVSYFKNGRELLDFLGEGELGKNGEPVEAFLVLLDLNMPVMDGRETLAVLKKSKKFRKIPVVVLSTSRAEEDVASSYDTGVNSYISKPAAFEDLVRITQSLKTYWVHTVEVPDA